MSNLEINLFFWAKTMFEILDIPIIYQRDLFGNSANVTSFHYRFAYNVFEKFNSRNYWTIAHKPILLKFLLFSYHLFLNVDKCGVCDKRSDVLLFRWYSEMPFINTLSAKFLFSINRILLSTVIEYLVEAKSSYH